MHVVADSPHEKSLPTSPRGKPTGRGPNAAAGGPTGQPRPHTRTPSSRPPDTTVPVLGREPRSACLLQTSVSYFTTCPSTLINPPLLLVLALERATTSHNQDQQAMCSVETRNRAAHPNAIVRCDSSRGSGRYPDGKCRNQPRWNRPPLFRTDGLSAVADNPSSHAFDGAR